MQLKTVFFLLEILLQFLYNRGEWQFGKEMNLRKW
jgi:hypothetical protein